MTSVYVARSLGVDGLGSGSTLGDIIGGDTALDTHDGDTSYVRVVRDGTLTGGTDHTQMSFRWELLSGGVPSLAAVTAVTVHAAFRRDDTGTPGSSAGASLTVPGVGTPGLTMLVPSVAPDDYLTYSQALDPFWADPISGGVPWRIFPLTPGFVERNALRVTYLRATIEAGVPHLRQRNRDTIRARNRASRQRGIRQRGYL